MGDSVEKEYGNCQLELLMWYVKKIIIDFLKPFEN
jgi:hypothetical protein